MLKSMPTTFGSICLLFSVYFPTQHTNKSGNMITSSIYDYGSFGKVIQRRAFGSGLCELTLNYRPCLYFIMKLSSHRPRTYCQFRRKSFETVMWFGFVLSGGSVLCLLSGIEEYKSFRSSSRIFLLSLGTDQNHKAELKPSRSFYLLIFSLVCNRKRKSIQIL
jgi:hypothetical protein